MAEAHPVESAGPAPSRRAIHIALVFAVGLFVLAGVLWARYGGAVFVEMLASVWAACF